MTELETVDLQQRLVDALYGPGKRRSDTVEELADAMIAIFASRASQQQGPEIKGLEWEKNHDALDKARSILGLYRIWSHISAPSPELVTPDSRRTAFPNIAAAKAAAQADYEARIRTALAPSVGAEEPTTQAPIPEGMVLVQREPPNSVIYGMSQWTDGHPADPELGYSDTDMMELYAYVVGATPAPQAEPGAGE